MTHPQISLDGQLAASLVHGGGVDGSNIVLFRRESIATPDGTVTRVPVLSGNGLRGVLRRTGAWLLAGDLDATDGRLGRNAVQILAAGGALRKETPPSVGQMTVLRGVPHLSLFGWAGAGGLHPGSLIVDKIVPVCAETAHLTGIESATPAGRLLDLEQFVRHDSTGGITPADLTVDGGEVGSNQMIYQVETLAAGTRLVGSLRFRPWATPADVWWARRVIAAWQTGGGHVGGRSGTGHGRWVAPLDGPVGDPPDGVPPVDDILDALDALG